MHNMKMARQIQLVFFFVNVHNEICPGSLELKS